MNEKYIVDESQPAPSSGLFDEARTKISTLFRKMALLGSIYSEDLINFGKVHEIAVGEDLSEKV